MAMLDEILGFLQAQGVGTAGADLFASMLPEAPDAVIAVYEYAGRPAEYVHEQPGPAYEQPRIQIVARASREDYASARDRAMRAYTMLGAVVNQALSGTRYLKITPLQTPFAMQTDKLARPHVGFNCEIFKEPS